MFFDRIVRATTRRIRTGMARGLIAPLDASATAEALLSMMSEHYLNAKLGNCGRRDWRRTVDALVTIWQRTLYGTTR